MNAAPENGNGEPIVSVALLGRVSTPPAETPKTVGLPCPICGGPKHPRKNRCYKCHPAGKGGGRPKGSKTANNEITAMAAIHGALSPLDDRTVARILGWVLGKENRPFVLTPIEPTP